MTNVILHYAPNWLSWLYIVLFTDRAKRHRPYQTESCERLTYLRRIQPGHWHDSGTGEIISNSAFRTIWYSVFPLPRGWK